MGFLTAMKGANNAWANVTSGFFEGIGYLGPKNLVDNRSHEMMISATSLKDAYVFTKADVSRIDLLCDTSEWVKFKICFKDGKTVIATFMALDRTQNGIKPSTELLNFESWMSGVIYCNTKNVSANVPSSNSLSVKTAPVTANTVSEKMFSNNVEDENHSANEKYDEIKPEEIDEEPSIPKTEYTEYDNEKNEDVIVPFDSDDSISLKDEESDGLGDFGISLGTVKEEAKSVSKIAPAVSQASSREKINKYLPFLIIAVAFTVLLILVIVFACKANINDKKLEEAEQKLETLNQKLEKTEQKLEKTEQKLEKTEQKLEEITDKHEHTYGGWIDYSGNESSTCENRLFYHICTECSAIEWKSGSYDNHKFDTVTTPPTCVSKGFDTKTCNICGTIEIVNETEIVDHTWKTEYSHNGSFHWYDCEYCDATDGYAEHSVDDSGYCTACDQPLAPSEGIIYDISADGTHAEVIDYTGAAKRLVIADEYEGVPVTSIAARAFYNNQIISVIMSDNIKHIGRSAFDGCHNLENISFSKNLETIDDNAFSGCYRLASVFLPENLKDIGSAAFYQCHNLDNICIPNGVTQINTSTFFGCEKLTTIILPQSLTSIESNAFTVCRNLKSVTIPKNVNKINWQAFGNCSNLENVIFENTEGWRCTSSGHYTELASEKLQDPCFAALYLTSTYLNDCWERI